MLKVKVKGNYNITRLGPPRTEADAQPRPILADLASEEARNRVLKKMQKLEWLEGGVLEKGLHTPRLDAKRERNSQEGGARTEDAQSSRRGEFDNSQWEDCGQEKPRVLMTVSKPVEDGVRATSHQGFKCIYFNAQSLYVTK